MTDSIQGGPECIDVILDVVSDYYKIPVDAIKKDSRKREVLLPRQISMTLSLKYTKASLAKVGWIIGKKDHATVMHARKVITNLIQTDKTFRSTYREIDQMTEVAVRNKIYQAHTKVCEHCGSSIIVSLYWVNINNNKIHEKAETPDEVLICLSCNRQTVNITKEEYHNLIQLHNDIEKHTLETISA